MNKVIFQIGILAFCVSIVAFGAQQMALMQTLSRSFIVFVGVVVTCVILYTITAATMEKARKNTGQTGGKGHGLHNIGAERPAQPTKSPSA
jgi:Na+-transporting NADH:ubiquinone oxidoreductase subunit NqrD